MDTERETIERIFTSWRTWAIVGASPDPYRASYGVGRFLQANGYRTIPVNPGVDSLWGEHCYPSLLDIPEELGVEVVDMFRRSDAVGAHVDEAISIGAKAVWMQLGVIDEATAARARAAGLEVVMDRCPKIELPSLGLGRRAS